MLGEKVGWVSKVAFFILKNKVKMWMVCPFHSCIIRAPVGVRPGGRAGAGRGSLQPRHATHLHLKKCHGMSLFIILPDHIFILKW